jgi:hypothetical protein
MKNAVGAEYPVMMLIVNKRCEYYLEVYDPVTDLHYKDVTLEVESSADEEFVKDVISRRLMAAPSTQPSYPPVQKTTGTAGYPAPAAPNASPLPVKAYNDGFDWRDRRDSQMVTPSKQGEKKTTDPVVQTPPAPLYLSNTQNGGKKSESGTEKPSDTQTATTSESIAIRRKFFRDFLDLGPRFDDARKIIMKALPAGSVVDRDNALGFRTDIIWDFLTAFNTFRTVKDCLPAAPSVHLSARKLEIVAYIYALFLTSSKADREVIKQFFLEFNQYDWKMFAEFYNCIFSLTSYRVTDSMDEKKIDDLLNILFNNPAYWFSEEVVVLAAIHVFSEKTYGGLDPNLLEDLLMEQIRIDLDTTSYFYDKNVGLALKEILIHPTAKP